MKQQSLEKLPKHVAVIMDGNGRWAEKRGINRLRGHEEGAKAAKRIVRVSREIGIQWLTLFTFSEENWKRPTNEIKALMKLLNRFLKNELQEMLENGIRLQVIGRMNKLPKSTQKTLIKAMNSTISNSDLVLILALSYGGRQEILDAVKKIARSIEQGQTSPDDISDKLFASSLYTAGIPDPDLLIRTSGEYRLSNFLLYQLAYTEFYITDTLWPDMGKDEFIAAIKDFQQRERRFGATRS